MASFRSHLQCSCRECCLCSGVNCARWLLKVASSIHTHLPEIKSITYLFALGTGEKAEAWKCEMWLVFSAVHVVCINARKLCNMGTVFQQG